MRKWIMVLTLILLFVGFKTTECKAETYSGTCGEQGDNLTWVLDEEGTLTISGAGKMVNFDYNINQYPQWYDYREQIVEIIISEGVTSIGSCAFNDCSNLKKATIPNSIIFIGSVAFGDCINLSDISIPSSVNEIGNNAFENCKSIPQVTLSKGIVGKYAFLRCESLSRVYMEEGVISIEEGAFAECTSLTTVNLPSTLTYIGSIAFGGCTLLEGGIVIPDGIDTLRAGTFSNCSHLTSIQIPESVLSIEDGVFSKTGLKSVSIPDSVTSIGIYAFSDCYELESINLGNGVAEIGKSAFRSCPVKSLFLPSSLVSIDFGFFDNSCLEYIYVDEDNLYYSDVDGMLCNKEKTILVRCPHARSREVIIPDTVCEIAERAFYNCDTLQTVTFSKSVKKIGNSAFCFCSNLKTVILSQGLEVIPEKMFFGCGELSDVSIPETVKTIGKEAFSSCSGLTSIFIPASVQLIEQSAFASCSGLRQLEIAADNPSYYSSDGLVFSKDKKILLYALEGAGSDLAIPEGTEVIAESCFSVNNIITSLIIPDSVKVISDYAFDGCTFLEHVCFGTGLTKIGSYAFYYCLKLKEVNLPNNTIEIGTGAFKECVELETFRAPGKMIGNGGGLFLHCIKLSEITIGSISGSLDYTTVEETEYYNNSENWVNGCLFLGSYLLKAEKQSGSINIPEGTTAIADFAFFDNTELTEVFFPNSLERIGYGAFVECDELREVHLNEGLRIIEGTAFSGKIRKIELPSTIEYLGNDFCSTSYKGMNELKFSGSRPEIDDKAFQGIAPAIVYYPYHDPSWDGISDFDFGGRVVKKTDAHGNIIETAPGISWVKYNPTTSKVVFSDIYLPNNVKVIEKEAFADCLFEKIQLPDGVTAIESKAFYNCKNLKMINIPESVVLIFEDAFDNCNTNLVIIGSRGSMAEKYANDHGFIFRDELSELMVN